MIEIRFKTPDDTSVFSSDSRGLEGQISVSGFRESFLAPVTYWSRHDYEESWRENLETIRSRGSGYLATEITDPSSAALFVVWPVFWVGEMAHLTQKLLLRRNWVGDFLVESIPEMVDYEKMASSIGEFSSWQISDS